jgi:glucose/arabinose dehydrogenase
MIALRGAGLMTALALAATGLPQGLQAGSPGVALQRLLPGERLARPLHLVEVPDGSGRFAVTEQAGRVKTFRASDKKATGVLLDIRERVSTRGNEEGLLSLAFDPLFRSRRVFYVYYSAANPRRSVISRFTLQPGRLQAMPESEQIIMEVAQPYSNHNGGQLAFGPDGFLYIALGDGGSGGDPLGNGQNRGTLLGAILRIDVRARGDALRYAMPPDNPFANAKDGSRPEIWAYGLRNPWRFSFDRKTGDLYAGDVGQNLIEEVDRVVKGGNYGWNIMEGTVCYQPGTGCRQEGLRPPISEYDHEHGIAVTGGFVYRGRALPALYGRYLFGDFGSGTIWSIPAGGDHPRKPELLMETELALASFGEDLAGELYLVDLRGGVFKLVPAP